ncbi:hypothetical protein FOZ62_025449 [Perkinsus olseni]|uniref:Uncharacterized protein n=1 Tax=Perkinsus olseni TaxID=32597 RepID=A0A7J6TDI0_PEROL|nr:hypothetical protein FOZ62_025449 [Perkinsus olseni]
MGAKSTADLRESDSTTDRAVRILRLWGFKRPICLRLTVVEDVRTNNLFDLGCFSAMLQSIGYGDTGPAGNICYADTMIKDASRADTDRQQRREWLRRQE